MGIDIWNPRFGRSIFEDIDKEFAAAEDMLNRMFKTVHEMGPSATTRGGTAVEYPYYYGYQLSGRMVNQRCESLVMLDPLQED
jgi:hypothetical protein